MLSIKKYLLNNLFKKEIYEKKQEIKEEVSLLAEQMILERDRKLKESENLIFTLLTENQTLKTELILLNIKEDKKMEKEKKKEREVDQFPNILD